MIEMNSLPGLLISLLLLAAVVIVILALALVKHRPPAQEAAQLGRDVREEWKTAYQKMMDSDNPAYERPLSAVTTGMDGFFSQAEEYVDTEFDKLLMAAEKRLTDTSSEDTDIVTAQKAITAANAKKDAKLTALDAHVTKLAAYRTSLSTPAAGTGS